MKRFWTWFFFGYGARPGIARLADRWLLLHIGIGLALYGVVPLGLAEVADRVLLPLAGILIGLAFAWSGNAQAILASGELDKIVRHHKEGIESYVFTYQAAILYLLVTLCAWGIAGLGVIDALAAATKSDIANWVFGPLLYALASISIRECWHVVLSAQYFTLMRYASQSEKSHKP